MLQLNPLTYLVEPDGSILYIKDTTDYSTGIGVLDFQAYLSGIRVWQFTDPNGAIRYFSNKACSQFPGATVDSVFDITTSNNGNYTFPGAVLGALVSGVYTVRMIVFPYVERTIATPVNLAYYDIVFGLYGGGNNLFLAQISNPIPINQTQLVPFNSGIVPISFINLYGTLVEVPVGMESVTNPNQVKALIQLDCATNKVYVTDRTSYDVDGTRAGYDIDNYTNYTKLFVTKPDGTVVVLTDVPPASNGWYKFPVLVDDGLYLFNFVNLPVYDSTYTYQVGDCYTNGSAIILVTSTGTEVISVDDLSERFSVTYPIPVVCSAVSCIDDQFLKTSCVDPNCINELCRNQKYQNVLKASILLLDLEIGYTNESKTTPEYNKKVNDNINILKKLCSCSDH